MKAEKSPREREQRKGETNQDKADRERKRQITEERDKRTGNNTRPKDKKEDRERPGGDQTSDVENRRPDLPLIKNLSIHTATVTQRL
jgi:hypothetical protein